MEEHLCQVDLAFDGNSGKNLALTHKYDVIIIDINLPHINGYELCKAVRVQNTNVPILMLTALGTTANKLAGFDAGTDDYLVKPFEFKELMARLKALHKRNSLSLSEPRLQVADLKVNLESKTVERNGQLIELTAREFNLLVFLMRNQNKVMSRADIAEHVWDHNFDTGTNVIDVYINFLRKKIDKDFSPKLIHTLVNMGYVLKEK